MNVVDFCTIHSANRSTWDPTAWEQPPTHCSGPACKHYLANTEPLHLLALAAAILALGVVHWLVREQDRRAAV